MQEKVGFCKGLRKVVVVGEGEKKGLEWIKWGEKWEESGLEWLWDKGLAERKCRRKGGGRGWDGREMGVGKSGDGEWMGVGWNWKMGMISDCYQL